jgi:DNA-binding MarR family transcriptional regulator
MTKQELISSQVFEKTSGMELINRMIRQGFIDQFQDEKDKRSMRLRITPSGRMEIIKVLPKMRQVSQIVSGNLTDREKVILGYILRKLDHFHNEIYLHSKDEELDDLIDKTKEP